MDLLNEYRNQEDQVEFFLDLDNHNKKDLYDQLDKEEKRELLKKLSSQNIKSFFTSLDRDRQKDILQVLESDKDKLRGFYNSLNDDEKQNMANLMMERQIELQELFEKKGVEITRGVDRLTNLPNEIERHKENIVNAEVEIANKQKEIQQNKVIHKKLQKERYKQLKKQIRLSRPSRLDKLGIFSKKRLNKLEAVTQALNEVNDQINNLRADNSRAAYELEQAKRTIEQENENIQKAKEEMLETKKFIHETAKERKQMILHMKKVSKIEKRVLGRKMHRQMVDQRDAVLTRKMNHQLEQTVQPIPQQEIPPQVHQSDNQEIEFPHLEQPTPQREEKHEQTQTQTVPNNINTQVQIENMLKNIEALKDAGVNMFMPGNFGNQIPKQDASLLENAPNFTVSKEQLVVMMYVVAALNNYMLQMLQQQTQEMGGRSRVKSNPNAGIVNFTLLISIMLFLFSLLLFFIK